MFSDEPRLGRGYSARRRVAQVQNRPDLTVAVVTSDSGLIARCRKAARARGRAGRLDIVGSVRFSETTLRVDAAPAAADRAPAASDTHVAVAKALSVATEKASLRRVRNKRVTRKSRKAAPPSRAFSEATANLAAATARGLAATPVAAPDAALNDVV